jgi:hypothetical protein
MAGIVGLDHGFRRSFYWSALFCIALYGDGFVWFFFFFVRVMLVWDFVMKEETSSLLLALVVSSLNGGMFHDRIVHQY